MNFQGSVSWGHEVTVLYTYLPVHISEHNKTSDEGRYWSGKSVFIQYGHVILYFLQYASLKSHSIFFAIKSTEANSVSSLTLDLIIGICPKFKVSGGQN